MYWSSLTVNWSIMVKFVWARFVGTNSFDIIRNFGCREWVPLPEMASPIFKSWLFFFQVRWWPSPGFHPLLTVDRDSGEQLFSFSSLCRWCNLRNDLQPMMTHLFSPLLTNIDGGPQRVIFHASLGLEGPLEVSNVNALVSRLPVVVCRFSSTWVLQEKLYQNGKKLW